MSKPTYETLKVCRRRKLRDGTTIYVSGKALFSINGSTQRWVYLQFDSGERRQITFDEFLKLLK